MNQKKAKIMVIDDTPANLKLLAEILCGQDYHVLTFPSGAAALKNLQKTLPLPDLILLDIMMPEMDGFEVCRILKNEKRLHSIPVIFISAMDDIQNKIRAFTNGGVDYITKPFQEEELLARVKTHLNLRFQQEQIENQKKEIQQSYNRLLSLENLRDSLVHMMAHDMNTPLMTILGSTELLDMKLGDTGDETFREKLNPIYTSVHTLKRMIKNFLDVSRLEADRMPARISPCNPDDLISNVLNTMDILLQNIQISWERADTPVKLLCDPDITHRILENLIGNAIKYAGKKGEIAISVSAEEDGLKFQVKDTGPGIPMKYHSHIFEKFTQRTDLKKDHPYGAGLGLAFCKLAVECQGGRIGFESFEGKGCTFWFILPSTKSIA